MKIFFSVFSLAVILIIFPFRAFCQKTDNYLAVAAMFKESLEYEKAIEVLENVPESNKDQKIRKYLAKLYYLTGRLDESADILHGLKDKDWFSFLYLGLICEEKGKDSLAIKNYLNSLKLNNNGIASYRLGKIYYRKKKYSKAVEYFSEAISFDPSMRLAYYYLGESYLMIKDYKQAYTYFAKANNFYPGRSKIKEKLEIVKGKLGKDFFDRRKREQEERRRKVTFPRYEREKGIPYIRVGIAEKLKEFTFQGKQFTLSDGEKVFSVKDNRRYVITFRKDKLILRDYKSQTVRGEFSGKLKINCSQYPFYVFNVTYGEGDYWHKEIDRLFRGDFEVIKNRDSLTLVNILSVEEYLYGVLAAEISPSADLQALKAQAVAARTIAFKNMGRHRKQMFDVCSDVHCQVYHGMSGEAKTTIKAVKETKGQILVFNDQPIEAFYHSNCGGCLRSDVFGRRTYLEFKADSQKALPEFTPYQEEEWFMSTPLDTFSSRKGSSFRWQRVYDSQDLEFVFGEGFMGLIPLQKGDCFHYDEVEVTTSKGKAKIEGDFKIRRYLDNLRSSAFKIDLKASAGRPEMVFFWGAGFGHAAGLSQQGAVSMAESGYNYQDILNHYYPNTDIKDLY